MTAWKITYRYPVEPNKLYARTVNADDQEGALRTFHSCGAHSDDVIRVELVPEFTPRQRRMIRADMREQIRRGHW